MTQSVVQAPEAKLETTHETVTDQIATGMASLVWWQFSGCAIKTDELRSVVAAAGLDPDSVKDIDPVAAIKRACKEFSVTEKGRKIMEAVITSADDQQVMIDILVREERNVNGKKRTFKVPFDRLVWDRLAGDWSSKGIGDAASTKLVERVHLRQNYHDGNDVRSYVVVPALQGSKSFPLTRGMYVVVRDAAEPIAKAQEALKAVESFRLNIGTVTTNMGFDNAIQANAEEYVRDELAELQEQIDGWRDMASRVRSDTIEHVLGRFNELRERALMYSNALSATLNGVEADIDEMEAIANEVLDGNRAAAESRQAEKNASASGMTVGERRRQALTGLPVEQLGVLWDSFFEGEDKPEDSAEMVEKIAVRMEAAA